MFWVHVVVYSSTVVWGVLKTLPEMRILGEKARENARYFGRVALSAAVEGWTAEAGYSVTGIFWKWRKSQHFRIGKSTKS